MKLTIAIAVFNQLSDTKSCWGSHVQNVENKNEVELLVVDNGSNDGSKEWIEKFVFPHFPDHKCVRNEENIGLVATQQQIYKEAKGDVIAIIHNDLLILEKGWDARVVKLFESNPNIGLAGFFGYLGLDRSGGRFGCSSNFVEAEVHGDRFTGEKRVLGFDGISLICSRAMLDKVGGFDQEYCYHHFYDKDISMASAVAGFENWYIGVYCHHFNGLTANRPDYQTWIEKKMGTSGYTGDITSYKASEARFISKWKDRLPYQVRI